MAAREHADAGSDPMVWALLAAYLTKRPPWVQAGVLGLCTGLFVTAGVEADTRDPRITSVILWVLTVAIITGGLFFPQLRESGRGRHRGDPSPMARSPGGADEPPWGRGGGAHDVRGDSRRPDRRGRVH